MCRKCAGLTIIEPGFETPKEPVSHCVNCGNYEDATILRNRHLTPTEREGYHLGGEKSRRTRVRNVPQFVLSNGGVLLGHSGLFGTM